MNEALPSGDNTEGPAVQNGMKRRFSGAASRGHSRTAASNQENLLYMVLYTEELAAV
jgi:hypothetical protein